MSGAGIVLASSSMSRRAMLEAAGVIFTTSVPDIDEAVMKSALIEKGADAAGIADGLAEAKAVAVSQRHRDAFVIGSDQVLVCEGGLFSKCADENEAREALKDLRGREHQLISAVTIARNAKPVWRHRESARLHMRDFSDAFLNAYLTMELPDVLGSVGVYRIEGRGAQLFDRVEGDQFCIRGLPLIPVLGALRELGALPS